jgi:molybdopterin-guanine dinucleotide biosynthesis protein A
MKNSVDISGFILAGGKSTRMGTDKALLDFHGKSFLEQMVSIIKPFCNSISICGNNSGYESFGLTVIHDSYPHIGPIAGIYSALFHTTSEWNLIVSVDTPFLDADLIQRLISRADHSDCIIPKHEMGVEPLAGLYRKSALEKVSAMIQKKDFKLIHLLSELNTSFLDCDTLVKQNPRLFTNINRRNDYLSI